MKTLIALTIALAGFGSTLAWSAPPASASTSASAPAAAKALRHTAPKSARSSRAPAAPVVPAFNEQLLEGPAVLCACGRSRTQA